MPAHRNRKPGVGVLPPALALLSAAFLAGCLGGESTATRSANDPARAALVSPTMDRKGTVQSELIGALSARRSVLPKGSSYAKVAASVLAASAGAAESELRVARLTARAKSKNWLPSIGPNVSLNSLGSLAASLLLDQALLDNGRRKAERAHSAADVEVAAVSLAIDLNQRVYDGLNHYLSAQRAAELAGITDTALVRMRDFDRIMNLRVEGGLSDRSEYRIIAQKVAEMEATLAQEREATTTASGATGRHVQGRTGVVARAEPASRRCRHAGTAGRASGEGRGIAHQGRDQAGPGRPSARLRDPGLD
ncbi:hypothetical protein MASR1M32_08030 [Rhodobacter sp.]